MFDQIERGFENQNHYIFEDGERGRSKSLFRPVPCELEQPVSEIAKQKINKEKRIRIR